ncbi:hypothetical protein MP228_011163 [Amoeboaphelidium protococcarum]|nr:hypothetical protein MP228_011163 [Amoeboaphelidium protococcarum]
MRQSKSILNEQVFVESTGTTGFKDVHLVPGEVFFCGVAMEAHLGSLGNLKVDKYVSQVNEAHYVLSLAVHELESLDRVIRAAEQSVSSLFGLSDRLRQLRAVDGVIRLRRKLAKKERKANVQKIDGAVVPAGYEIQPCFLILDVASKSLQSGDVRRGGRCAGAQAIACV